MLTELNSLLEFYRVMSPFLFTAFTDSRNAAISFEWHQKSAEMSKYNGHGYGPAAIFRMETFSATANNWFKWKLYFN